MSAPTRRRQGAPSWLGTLVVAVALVVMCLRAAAELRRSVTPTAGGAGAGTGEVRSP